MFKNGPKEKEKILRRLTEREIKDQLYSFENKQSRPPVPQPAVSHQVRAEEIVKPKQILPKVKEVKEKQVKKVKKENAWFKANKKAILQFTALIVFLYLIIISISQIIKIILRPRQAKPEISLSYDAQSRPDQALYGNQQAPEKHVKAKKALKNDNKLKKKRSIKTET